MRVGALLLLASAMSLPAAQPAPVAVEVTHQGFCLHKTGTRCEEVALPVDVPIDIGRLPRLEDGRRGIYFYSDQVVSAKVVFVHVLEAEDDDARVDFHDSESARAERGELAAKLRKLVKTLQAAGRVSITPFRANPGEKTLRVFSSLPIEGPGSFAARVVDLNGALIPSSTRIRISVMQGRSAAPR